MHVHDRNVTLKILIAFTLIVVVITTYEVLELLYITLGVANLRNNCLIETIHKYTVWKKDDKS